MGWQLTIMKLRNSSLVLRGPLPPISFGDRLRSEFVRTYWWQCSLVSLNVFWVETTPGFPKQGLDWKREIESWAIEWKEILTRIESLISSTDLPRCVYHSDGVGWNEGETKKNVEYWNKNHRSRLRGLFGTEVTEWYEPFSFSDSEEDPRRRGREKAGWKGNRSRRVNFLFFLERSVEEEKRWERWFFVWRKKKCSNI